MLEIQTFIRRMMKLGYKVELWFNYPWIYIEKINGNIVTEKNFSDHGWTLCLYPTMINSKVNFINLSQTIKLIRKYGKE